MEVIEIARKLSALGERGEALKAYTLALRETTDPAFRMEAAVYILRSGGDYRVSYTCFQELYREGYFQPEILELMTKAFYEPNVKLMKSRYERNCKSLKKYPYIFRKDFIPFSQLPIRFYPYDDNSYIPFYRTGKKFGGFVNVRDAVISRNFFKDLENPILAADVYSQYELEYLNDNVRCSEDIGRENHIYLHYTDWSDFCAWLQVLSFRRLLESKKIVFLIGREIDKYPIDFQKCFGIDYSQYKPQPVRVREVTRMIWHTQLSSHNGGDFFNEIFDAHPNLICMPSVMMYNIEEIVQQVRDVIKMVPNLQVAERAIENWPKHILRELYQMRDRTDKDLLVGFYLSRSDATSGLDANSRIAPALFFQPHFHNIVYHYRLNQAGETVMEAKNVEEIHSSPLFRNFKYIKTFTPLRRFTNSHAATVRFMHMNTEQRAADPGEKKTVITDVIMERILNRSFMIDPDDRLYHDSILVRFEDGKLNPEATFTVLAEFLDLPYADSMTYCSEGGQDTNGLGFDPVTVYNKIEEYANGDERYFIEYFLRDAYEFYGYDFQYYDGQPMDEEKIKDLISKFTTMNYYMRQTWGEIFREAEVSQNGERVDAEIEKKVQGKLLDNYMKGYDENRLNNAKILMGSLRFVNKHGQPLRFMKQLQPNPALLEQPLYH